MIEQSYLPEEDEDNESSFEFMARAAGQAKDLKFRSRSLAFKS